GDVPLPRQVHIAAGTLDVGVRQRAGDFVEVDVAGRGDRGQGAAAHQVDVDDAAVADAVGRTERDAIGLDRDVGTGVDRAMSAGQRYRSAVIRDVPGQDNIALSAVRRRGGDVDAAGISADERDRNRVIRLDAIQVVLGL